MAEDAPLTPRVRVPFKEQCRLDTAASPIPFTQLASPVSSSVSGALSPAAAGPSLDDAAFSANVPIASPKSALRGSGSVTVPLQRNSLYKPVLGSPTALSADEEGAVTTVFGRGVRFASHLDTSAIGDDSLSLASPVAHHYTQLASPVAASASASAASSSFYTSATAGSLSSSSETEMTPTSAASAASDGASAGPSWSRTPSLMHPDTHHLHRLHTIGGTKIDADFSETLFPDYHRSLRAHQVWGQCTRTIYPQQNVQHRVSPALPRVCPPRNVRPHHFSSLSLSLSSHLITPRCALIITRCVWRFSPARASRRPRTTTTAAN
jgi:hypothetical protein